MNEYQPALEAIRSFVLGLLLVPVILCVIIGVALLVVYVHVLFLIPAFIVFCVLRTFLFDGKQWFIDEWAKWRNES